MIGEIFLKKALNIKKDYLKISNDIKTYEDMVSSILKSLDKYSNELESLNKKIESKEISNVDSAKNEMMGIIINLETEVNKATEYIDIMNLKIDNLRGDENTLYKEIKEKYPEISDDSIKEEIHNYIKPFL